MTWSVVTHDPASGVFAVAVATCALAIGASARGDRRGRQSAAMVVVTGENFPGLTCAWMTTQTSWRN